MTRVDENREAQRQEEQRRLEEASKEKANAQKREFSRLLDRRPAQAPKLPARPRGDGKAGAASKLLARQGIDANRFSQALQEQGQKHVEDGRVQSKSRGEEMGETRRAGEDKQAAADNKRVDQQGDRLAAISRDDRRGQGDGGGLGGGAHSGADGDAAGSGLGGSGSQAALGVSPGASRAAQAHAPRLPPQVINEMVERVMVGVTPQGLSTFVVEFKESVLGGSRLQVTAKDGKISASFTTADANIRRLLKASEGELARAFAGKGMTLERLDVQGP